SCLPPRIHDVTPRSGPYRYIGHRRRPYPGGGMTTLDQRRTRVQTYYGRRGRLRTRRREALARLLPVYGVDVHGGPPDPAELFGRHAPLVLEIGSGMGDATAEMAAADPDRDYLAAEVHAPGVANLLLLIEERGLTNLRVRSEERRVGKGRRARWGSR